MLTTAPGASPIGGLGATIAEWDIVSDETGILAARCGPRCE